MVDEKEEISRRLSGEGLVASAVCFDKIIEGKVKLEDIIDEAKREGRWLITDDFLEKFVSEEEEIQSAAQDISEPEKPKVEVVKTKRVFAEEVDSRLEVITESDVSGKSTCDGHVEDFIGHFNKRYKNISRILRERISFRSPTQIDKLKKRRDREAARIICMVSDKRESNRGFRFLDVEDPSGQITVLIPSDNTRLKRMHEQILLDEVIGIEGTVSNDIFIAQDIVQPEIPITNQSHTADEEVCVALLSDLHIGSYLFLEKEFSRFLDWLSGKGDKTELSGRIKYVIVAGDLVDGIGIYPNQDKELVIPDIYKQYEFLSYLIERIPDYIEVVLAMGNHDAVRNAEPQPMLPKDVGEPLFDLPNVHVVGNPATVSTHGVRTLVYHGTTLDTIIGSLVDSTYAHPENAMIEYLMRRHLAPTYGRDNLAPEEVDYMSITTVPDILHCGHVHTNGYAQYRGVRVINSGTWQGKTRYQEQLGHQPTPARLPIVNLANLEVSVMNFGD